MVSHELVCQITFEFSLQVYYFVQCEHGELAELCFLQPA